MKNMTIFSFLTRWKEELVVSCPDGKFIFEQTMGVSGVYLPTEAAWLASAPPWAEEMYAPLKAELAAWCKREAIPMTIDEKSWASFEE